MKVLVCGSRFMKDRELGFEALSQLFNKIGSITKVIEGGALGADRMAREWATSLGIPFQTFQADWTKGKRAGPLRNARMLAGGQPDAVLAFPGGRGTQSMVKLTRQDKLQARQENRTEIRLFVVRFQNVDSFTMEEIH